MTLRRLLLRNLFYHWRGNLAVLLGVVVGTAVLTGALLVGDSLRGSLRALTLEQLGWVEDALVTGRFFREEVASSIKAERVCPAILLQGSATARGKEFSAQGDRPVVRRAARVTLLGVDDRFWDGFGDRLEQFARRFKGGSHDSYTEAETALTLNQSLANDLQVQVGNWVTLQVQKVSQTPRETLLGHRQADEVVEQLTLKVERIIPDNGPGRFSLNPGVSVPRNAFVPLSLVQEKFGLKGRINALLVRGGDDLPKQLRQALDLEDWGLVLRSPQSRTDDLFAKYDREKTGEIRMARLQDRVAEIVLRGANSKGSKVLKRADLLAYYQKHRNYLSLESRQTFLEPAVVAAARQVVGQMRLRAAPTLVYLADTLSFGKQEVPYAIVAALDLSLSPPLGESTRPLAKNQIVLSDWIVDFVGQSATVVAGLDPAPLAALRPAAVFGLRSLLPVNPGDPITLTYYHPDSHGGLEKKYYGDLTWRYDLPLQGFAADPDLTPEFPGVTDQIDLRNWENPPFPYDRKRVHFADEVFWKWYRTTPKAYIHLETGINLWASRFGQYTSIRLAPRPASQEFQTGDLEEIAEQFRRSLLNKLPPERGGFVFEPVRERGLQASAGGTDFGVLFLAFSVFLIVAALLLVGLLVRLNLDRRAAEIGLLLATGYRRGLVRRLLLVEGAVLAAVGGLLGVGGAVLYAHLLLDFLAASWPDSAGQTGLRSVLQLHVTPDSLLVGYVVALAVSLLTIVWATRVLGRLAPSALLSGETTATESTDSTARRPRWSRWIALVAAAGALGCLATGFFVSDPEGQAMSFFSSGALLLTAFLAGVWLWMHRSRQRSLTGRGSLALTRLGVRNAARHPVRSLLTVGLLASATFLVVAVQSFHRDPGQDFLQQEGGSGGFALLGESDVPIFENLNDPKVRKEYKLPAEVSFVPLRLRAGDDASCLNLYQPKRPRLLGVPHSLVERGGFYFAATEGAPSSKDSNPWHLLEERQSDGAIPVFGESNTVKWMLKSGLGQEIEVPNGRGEPVRLRVVGLLQDSVFQSELLMSEANFLKLFPRQEGAQFFLIAAPPEEASRLRAQLETALAPYGFSVSSSLQRLAAYLAVENTYLATFQALGGLGLLLGALGLAVVLLRSVWERRGELALLRALGFRRSALGWLVLAENSYLLLLGLAGGTLAALAAVAPQLIGGEGVLDGTLIALLGLVLVVGLASAAVAVAMTLRAPLLPALRRE
jgi:ABC-type lipoprotein release transport system permease subunit